MVKHGRSRGSRGEWRKHVVADVDDADDDDDDDDNDNDLDNNEDVGDNFEGCLEQVDVTRDLEVDR